MSCQCLNFKGSYFSSKRAGNSVRAYQIELLIKLSDRKQPIKIVSKFLEVFVFLCIKTTSLIETPEPLAIFSMVATVGAVIAPNSISVIAL